MSQVQQQSTMRVTHKGVTTTVVQGPGSPTKRTPAGTALLSTCSYFVMQCFRRYVGWALKCRLFSCLSPRFFQFTVYCSNFSYALSGITAKSTPGKSLKNGTTLNSTSKANQQHHKALSEKGWVSQLKPTAHNYHLKNLQNASVAAVEVRVCTLCLCFLSV